MAWVLAQEKEMETLRKVDERAAQNVSRLQRTTKELAIDPKAKQAKVPFPSFVLHCGSCSSFRPSSCGRCRWGFLVIESHLCAAHCVSTKTHPVSLFLNFTC